MRFEDAYGFGNSNHDGCCSSGIELCCNTVCVDGFGDVGGIVNANDEGTSEKQAMTAIKKIRAREN